MRKLLSLALCLVTVMLVFALGSVLVNAAPLAQAADESSCPAPDTNGSSPMIEYAIPTANSEPTGIVTGADGALWYVPSYGQTIGRLATDGSFTEFPFPLAHDGDQHFLAPGPDGAIWFTDDWQNMIGRITSDGTITEFPIPTSVPDTDVNDIPYMTSLPRGLVTGADGALWFTELFGNNIGRITTEGEITEYPIPTADSGPIGIALGSDGAVWFVERNANQIGRITTDGEITEYPIPTPESFALRIVAGPDGALWFTEFMGNNIGRITTDGEITEYPIPTAGANPTGMTAGFGAIWFTEYSGNNIGCITTEGEITEYPIPTAESVPFNIAAGTDGAVWFTENAGGNIGRFEVQAAPAVLQTDAVTQAATIFSPQTYTLPVTFSFGAEWHIAEEYSDVVSLSATGFDGFFSFIDPTSIEVAGPRSSFSAMPFPGDFATWIQDHGLFQVVNTQPVVVGGIAGTQIDADATAACGTRTPWLFLARTGWNCALGVHYRFIDMDDVYGQRLLIMLEGYASPEAFASKVEATQEILDSIVFTGATVASAQTQTTYSTETFELPLTVSFGADWNVVEERPEFLGLELAGSGGEIVGGLQFDLVTDAQIADPNSSGSIPWPDDFIDYLQTTPRFEVGQPTPTTVGGVNGVQIDGLAIANGQRQNFITLSGGGMIFLPDDDEMWRFTAMEDIGGERLLITYNGPVEGFSTYAALAQDVVETVVFTN